MGSGDSKYDSTRSGNGTIGSHDNGYKGGTDSYHSIGDNIDELQSEFEYNNGYFGKKGGGRRTRHEYSDEPISRAKEFYDIAGNGGIERPMANGEGVTCTMADGTVISLRETSHSDGSPAVDINIRNSTGAAGIKEQKIHFMPKKGN